MLLSYITKRKIFLCVEFVILVDKAFAVYHFHPGEVERVYRVVDVLKRVLLVDAVDRRNLALISL